MAQNAIGFLYSRIKEYLWWRYMPGVAISVKWPSGVVEVGPTSSSWDGVMHGGCRQMQESADPNDHYRPWLENNAGKQGWDWDWCVGPDKVEFDDISYGAPIRSVRSSTLVIRFRKKKAKWATIAALIWA